MTKRKKYKDEKMEKTRNELEKKKNNRSEEELRS